MKQTINIKCGDHLDSKTIELPNKAHLDAQMRYKSQTYVDRKKRSKNGYRKHKRGDLNEI